MRPFLPFKLGAAWRLLDALPVQEVLGAGRWVVIPGAPPPLVGVMSWRGRAIAVLDLAVLLAEPVALVIAPAREEPVAPRGRTLVVTSDGATLAMPVDQVREVVLVDESAVRPSRSTHQPLSGGEVDLGGAPAPVLDLGQLFARVLGSGVEAPARDPSFEPQRT